MEIILKEDVIGLGYKNDIVKVKSGYGRNYLIPTGKAVIASESAKKVLAENLRQQAVKLAKIKAAAQEVADKLAGVALTISTKVSNAGTIYGSEVSVEVPFTVVAEGAPVVEEAPVAEVEAPVEEAPEVEDEVEEAAE